MTREEAIIRLKEGEPFSEIYDAAWNEALEMAIKALEQEPCEDAVSKQGVAKILLKYVHNAEGKAFAEFLIGQINDLPSVNPQKPCEDAISRQAVLDITWEEPSYTDAMNVLTEVRDKVKELPSVNPQKAICPSAGVDCEDCPAYEPKVLNNWIGAEVLDRIRNEMHATAEKHEDGVYYLRDEWVDEIIDKYAEGSGEE